MAAEPRDETLQQDAPQNFSVGSKSKSVPWYDASPSPTSIPASARHLLETYSRIPASDVTQHVIAVRERAWE
ncbi:hypothetical protein LTS18_003721, partial [Coniosporium uncinatum]